MQQDKSGQFFIKSLQGLYVREVYRFLVHLMRHACMSFGWTNTSTNIKWLFNETVEQRRVCASSPCAYSASGSAMSPNPLHHDRALPPFLAYLLADRCLFRQHVVRANRITAGRHGAARYAAQHHCAGPAGLAAQVRLRRVSRQPAAVRDVAAAAATPPPPARIPGRAGPSQGGIGTAAASPASLPVAPISAALTGIPALPLRIAPDLAPPVTPATALGA